MCVYTCIYTPVATKPVVGERERQREREREKERERKGKRKREREKERKSVCVFTYMCTFLQSSS